MKQCLLSLSLLLMAIFVQAQNPITPEGKFLSDPQPRQFAKGGPVYVYGSRDIGPLEWCSNYNDVLVSNDLTHWTLNENIFKSSDVDGLNAPLWAPDCIWQNGRYWLFYCTPDNNHKEGIAVSASPTGHFKDFTNLPKCKGIDPTVMRDDDGQIYYFWGQNSLKGAKLKPDMSGIDSTTITDGIVTDRKHHFHEGAQAFKRGDTYYICYADRSRNQPTCIGYSTAKSPFGPYTYRGVIIDNRGSNSTIWNNHGAVCEVNGRWYVFYHRPSNGVKTMRKACVEPIEFDENGLIKEVEMTSQGAGKPLESTSDIEARLACWMKGNVRVTTYPNGHEVLSGIQNGDSAVWRYVHFEKIPSLLRVNVTPQGGGTIKIYASKKGGHAILLASVKVRSGEGNGSVMDKMQVRVSVDATTMTAGDYAVSMSFEGRKEKELMTIDTFKFE